MIEHTSFFVELVIRIAVSKSEDPLNFREFSSGIPKLLRIHKNLRENPNLRETTRIQRTPKNQLQIIQIDCAQISGDGWSSQRKLRHTSNEDTMLSSENPENTRILVHTSNESPEYYCTRQTRLIY